MVLFLSNDDIYSLLTWKEVISVCEGVLIERSKGTAWFSPRQSYNFPTGSSLRILPGGAEKLDYMGSRLYTHLKAGSKGSHYLNAGALNIVYDMTSAEILALTSGEWINILRTAGVAAVSAKYLAKKNARSVAVFGTGMIAFGSVLSLEEIFRLDNVFVYSRDPSNRADFASKVKSQNKIPITPVPSPGALLGQNADILVTATSSREPVFDGTLLSGGSHVNCLGGEIPAGGREIDENAMSRFDVLSVLNKEHAMKGGVAEDMPNNNFKIAADKGMISWDDVVEIAEVIAGRVKGRRTDQDLTFFDGRAMGAFDVALSKRAYDIAIAKGVGVELDWGMRPSAKFRLDRKKA